MRISELAHASGVAVATIKYYLREGLLPPGRSTSATQATYDEGHLQRLRLIRSLVEVGGLPLAKVRAVLAVIDDPGPDPYAAVGDALAALPPYVRDEPPYARATAALEAIGLAHDPGSAAVAQLEAALAGLEAAGRPLDAEAVGRYAEEVAAIARREVASVEPDGSGVHDDPVATVVQDVVLGTVLVEPVILALRRIVHAALFRERHAAGDDGQNPAASR
ncbi:MerR family transcriptional regulator [Mumia sp. zg.B53]|uniref:MerR family transcriptional regulator n=1 Tax=unclassified Mumia TaxID=2621872 RepID=UPI001C6ED329|nr:MULTISPECIES: MerR family transcriptional regulator [unclassified Mumia]MBW9211246.1 MerR family transcriptional regulator [Mumia sp. zg.B21]MBW9215821.1 MerR family transcriptional regulator [Mumia sp. zg.B53]